MQSICQEDQGRCTLSRIATDGKAMTTDIKLDQQGGNWLVLEGSVLKTTASDLILDAPGRRRGGSSPHRRALVHDFQDGLTINFGGDYPGGVTVTGNLAVTGDLKLAGVALGATIASLQSALASVGGLGPRVETMERTVASLVELIGAVIVPPWRTRTEVEQGDDMGIWVQSAEELGLTVEYEIDQRNPAFGHEDVISTTPPAGSVVMRGSTVTVRMNLEG
jgi:hypothetical protein